MSSRGGVFRPTYTDANGNTKESGVYHYWFYVDGKKKRGTTGCRKKRDAEKVLDEKRREHGQGLATHDLSKVRFPQLCELILNDYKKNGRKSITQLKANIGHLKDAFGDWSVKDIQEPAIDAFVVDRLDDGFAPATVNRMLSALRRMFNLGKRARLVGRVPAIDMLEEKNVRRGFFEADQHAAVVAELPDYAKPIAEVAYYTGWRKGELLSREWRHVDLDAGWLRLDPGETKNGRGREFPLIPQLRAVLEAEAERKLRVERETDRIVTALFFRDNAKPIKSFRGAWLGAVKRAGCPERLFHDYRRTAARNLVRAGIPATQAKEFTGHKTLSVFDRYSIQDAASMKQAAAKYADSLPAGEANPPLPLDAIGKVQAK